MADRGPVRILDKPEPGAWAIRLRRGGPEVGAMIARIDHEPGNEANKLDTGPILYAEIDGKPVDPLRVWATRGRVITESEYRFMCASSAWARQWAPREPVANPDKAVDLSQMPIPFIEGS